MNAIDAKITKRKKSPVAEPQPQFDFATYAEQATAPLSDDSAKDEGAPVEHSPAMAAAGAEAVAGEIEAAEMAEMANASSAEKDQLAELAKFANAAIGEFESNEVSNIPLMLVIGGHLNKAKSLLPHGKYGTWADENIKAKRSWRAILMKLAEAARHLEAARAWAAGNQIEIDKSARGLIALVTRYLVAKGEIAAKPRKPVQGAKERLSIAVAQVTDMAGKLTAAEARLAERDAEIIRLKNDLDWHVAQLAERAIAKSPKQSD